MGDPHVSEEDLVELGFTGDLVQGTNVDALGLHVQQEVRQALVLGLVRIGPGHQHPPPRHMGQRRPDLLAVDDPLVAVTDRPARQAGHV